MWQFVGSNRGARIERIFNIRLSPNGLVNFVQRQKLQSEVETNFPQQILFLPASLNNIKHRKISSSEEGLENLGLERLEPETCYSSCIVI